MKFREIQHVMSISRHLVTFVKTFEHTNMFLYRQQTLSFTIRYDTIRYD